MSKTLIASIREHGDHIYIQSPLQLYTPEQAEIETFAFASDLRSAAPNPKIMWLRGQYVEADEPNGNADQWTAGELAIKALTPVLMPITVMHDLRSAVGTIADARLLTPAANGVPRARIDTTLAVWAHRFPEIARECEINAQQSTLMQSMECLSPYYDCSVCGKMMQRRQGWEQEWRVHASGHADAVASSGRSPARTLRNVTFTGVGLVFGTRGARGAMSSAHLQVEELAAMHREAHAGSQSKRPRRKNTVDIDDTKYEALVSAKSESEGKVAELTAKLQEVERKVETLESAKVTAEEQRDAEKKRADDAEEKQRVAAMKEDRLSKLGSKFVAELDKRETTAARTREQAAKLSDEDWTARLVELEEMLACKRDDKLDASTTNGNGNGNGSGSTTDATAGLLFDKKEVAASAVTGGAGGGDPAEVTAGQNGNGQAQVPSTVQGRQSVIGGLIKRPAKPTAGAKS